MVNLKACIMIVVPRRMSVQIAENDREVVGCPLLTCAFKSDHGNLSIEDHGS